MVQGRKSRHWRWIGYSWGGGRNDGIGGNEPSQGVKAHVIKMFMQMLKTRWSRITLWGGPDTKQCKILDQIIKMIVSTREERAKYLEPVEALGGQIMLSCPCYLLQ
jgi:hypothetical protein